MHVPAFSEMEVMATARVSETKGDWILEGEPQEKVPVMAVHAVVSPDEGILPVHLLNSGAEPATVYEGMRIAHLETVGDSDILDPASVAMVQPGQPPETRTEQEQLLWKVVEGNDNLSNTQREQLYLLLLSYKDLFAWNKTDFGRTNKIQHTIDTGSSAPIRQRIRRLPLAWREEMQRLLDDMLKKDVIRPSTSPWASPIVLVQKKDGSMRFCVNYCKVNAVTCEDAYLLPRVDDTLDTLSGSRWFTTLDLLSSYWQVEVSPGDSEKTAFCTPEGLFEFKVMPFSLCNAPATFQRLMDAVLAGLQWSSCLVYLDHVVIPGKSFEEHLRNLSCVFECLREAGLKLHPGKCTFCKKLVTFLGHIVSKDGVATDPAKTSKVANWPEPMSVWFDNSLGWSATTAGS